ncbi:MAG: hypothetical protein Q8P78_01840 [bacterium]|nr:hypothetical protein [bacterium]
MRILSRTTLAIAALVVVMALPDWSQAIPAPGSSSPALALTRVDSLVAIDRLTREIVAANPEYPDPFAVPIGALIRVPTATGPQVFYKTKPWQMGQRGCFWQIAAYHLYGKRDLPEPEPAFVGPVAPDPEPEPATQDKGFNFWLFLLALAAFLALYAAAYCVWGLIKRRSERELNPATHMPMVRNGLSEDPEKALDQVQGATSVYHGHNRFVQSVERGTLHDTNGRQSFIAPMEHGDGVTRDKKLNAGDQCYRVQVRIGSEQAEPVTEYWFRHCGNRFGEIKSGQFQLPVGWEFVPMPNQAAHALEPIQAPASADDAGVAEAADSIEGAAARIQAHTQAQAAVNPDGTYHVTFTVKNGTPEPTVVTATSDGHRPFRTIKYRSGAIEATF